MIMLSNRCKKITRLTLGATASLFSLAILGQGVPGQNPDPKQMLLDQLKDVKTPDAVNAWPPAFGWWILAMIVLASLIALVVFVRNTQQQARYRKTALKELHTIATDDPQHAAKLTMQLLKRVCFSAYPDIRANVAGLYGTHFLILLSKIHPHTPLDQTLSQTIPALIYGAPTPNAPANIDEFTVFATSWIRTHPKASKKTLATIHTLLAQDSAAITPPKTTHTVEAAHV